MITLPISTEPAPIPSTVHQIWVGGSPPRWVQRSWENWRYALKDLDEWDLRIWTDAEVAATPPLARTVERFAEVSPRGLANLLRVQIVAMYGGIYVDVDCVPIGPLAPLAGDRPGWIACAQKSRHQRQMENSCFGLPAQHPFLAGVFEQGRDATDDFGLAGSRAFRRVWDTGQHPDVEVRWDYIGTGHVAMRMALQDLRTAPVQNLYDRYGPCPIAHVFRPRLEPAE